MRLVLLMIITCLSVLTYGQSKVTDKQVERLNYQEVIGNTLDLDSLPKPDKWAMYPNGAKGLERLILRKMGYPHRAIERRIQGTVIVNFIVEKDGSIDIIEIEQSVDPLLDNEAIKVIKKFKPWVPGYKNGEAVRIVYRYPFVFKL